MDDGTFESVISSFRQPQGSYIVSAQPESSEFNITQLRTTQELKVGPRPLGAR